VLGAAPLLHSPPSMVLALEPTVVPGLRRPSPRHGLLLMVASAASFALMAGIAKRWLADTPTQAVVLSRGLLMSLTFIVLAKQRGVSLIGRQHRLLFTRGALGYVSLSCYFWSVQHLPLGDAVLLQYTHPIFVALLAPWLLRERTSARHWWIVLVAFLGVALVVGPTGELRGVTFVGLSGALSSGFAYIAIRHLAATEHPLTIMVWFPLLTIPGGLLGALLAGEGSVPRDLGEVGAHLGVAAAGMMGQMTLTWGLARIDAARGTAATMTGPAFGVLFGLLLFGTVPTPTSFAGMLVVTCCAIALARERLGRSR
jgi:drug/metabolite transporter (DMT)-like permease